MYLLMTMCPDDIENDSSQENLYQVDEPANEPWNSPWLKDELEHVKLCPVCGGKQRRVMFSGLIDNVFRVAPGYWELYECLTCASAYLDPRPTKESIGKAYKSYYTHNVAITRDETDQMSSLRLLRRALANGYLNKRYGTHYQPVSMLGPIFAFLFPRQREILDSQFRWLPKPTQGQQLLDIGSGNGGFLLKARDAGWQVIGVDPDPKAVSTVRALGVDVYEGDIDALSHEIESFDAITLNHVVEHVHEPRKLLLEINRLLKPNGTLYIATPNIKSIGVKIFGKNWRGIESPRHLILFNVSSLKELLDQCGFVDIEFKARRNIVKDIFRVSYQLQQELPYSSPVSRLLMLSLKLLSYLPFVSVSHLEFITLTARKKSS